MRLIYIQKKFFIFISLIILVIISVFILFSLPSSINIIFAAKNNTSSLILVNIEDKRLYLFQNNRCIKKYPIASGRPGWPSPIGQWQIVEKSDWGEGFGGRWLGLNVIWGKYGIHGTTQEGSIGSAASHGCIRMLNKDIKELYNLVSIGTPVIIEDGSYGPFGTGFRELRPGDRGADVLAVQQRLKELGYFKGKNTGIYEDNLKQSLYKFQKEKGLRIKYTITKDDYHAMGLQEFE